MKPLIVAFCVLFTLGNLSAQPDAWQPSPGHTEVPMWPKEMPDPRPVAGPEFVTTSKSLVAGRPWVAGSEPTMTVYSSKGTNTGVAVAVFPGGG